MSDDKKVVEPPHVESLRRQDKLNKLSAASRFRVAGGKVEKYEAAVSGDLETAVAAALKEHRFANPQIGDIDGRGIFLGIWEPRHKNGVSLKLKFNVFAAPENLPAILEYDDAVSHIAGLKKWHGHEGANYANDAALYEALENDAYSGGWFIPPGELLFGEDAEGNVVMPDNLRAHSKKGAFNDTFKSLERPGGDPEFYWSSTEHDVEHFRAHVVRFENGYKAYFLKDDCYFSCRPVRLEPRL